MRPAWWAAAVAVDLLAPAAAYWTPILGRANPAGWDVDPAHLAERCAGFVLIALGETVVVMGATFAGSAWNGVGVLGLVSAFLGAALWWIYFDTAAANTRRAFERAADRGSAARDAYTYLHAALVAASSSPQSATNSRSPTRVHRPTSPRPSAWSAAWRCS